MRNLLRVDLENCVNNGRFKICFGILFSISVVFTMFSINTIEGRQSNEIAIAKFQGMLVGSNGFGRSIFGLFILIMPLMIVAMYSDRYILEKRNGTYISLIQRAGKKRYILSKVIVSSFVSFMSVFIILSLNEIISYFIFNGLGSFTNGNESYEIVKDSIYMLEGNFYNNDFIAKGILIVINSVYAAMIGAIALVISFYFNIKSYALIIGVFIVEYLIDIMMPSSIYTTFSFVLARQGGVISIIPIILLIAIIVAILIILIKKSFKRDLI